MKRFFNLQVVTKSLIPFFTKKIFSAAKIYMFPSGRLFSVYTEKSAKLLCRFWIVIFDGYCKNIFIYVKGTKRATM